MYKGKILAFLGMAVIGLAVIAITMQLTQAQTTGPRLLQVADIDSINGMQTSNPLANYPAGNPAYPGQEIQYDNEGISIFIMSSSNAASAIKTDPSNASECGHLGIQSWQGANYAYKLTDGNTWQKRMATCNGIVVIGSSGQIRAQTLTISGTSVDGKHFTLQLNVPEPSSWDNEVGGGSRRLYVSDTGGVYACKSLTYRGAWPNECEYSPQAALQMSPVSTGMGATCGNGLCQYGESYASCQADCLPPPPTCTLTLNDNKTSYTSDSTTFVNYTYTCSSPTSVAVQVVKPDGIATTYNTATNITTSSMGFGTSNLTAGNYTLRICVNDNNTCSSPSSFVSVPFTITAPAACSKLQIRLDRGSNMSNVYTKGENVNYVFSCEMPVSAPAGNGTIKLVKPDGTVTTLITVTAASVMSHGYGFPTTDFADGTYMLKACMDAACTSASTGLVSFIVSSSGGASGSSDLVGHWKFDGNGNNEVAGKPAATIVGGSSFKTTGGQFSGYAYIPANGDAVKIPYNSAYDLPTAFTVEFWFRQRTNQSANQDLVSKGSGTNNFNFKIFRYLWNQYNNGAVITGFTSSSTGYWTQTSNPNEPPHNVWHHVAFTKDVAGSAYYIDGALIHSSSQTDSAKTPASDIIIGGTAVDTDIDDLKIYNRALTAGEITAVGGFPTPTPMPTVTPGAGAPEPTNNESGVWAQVDIATGQILTTAICTRAVCGLNGEYHGYVPPPTWATGSTWWPTTKRYIWQMQGQAGYSSGTFNFTTYIFTVPGGTIYNGIFTPTATPTVPTTTPTGSCQGPYHVMGTAGTCVWSCGVGTEPDNVMNQCKCQAGLTDSGADQLGRKICTATGTPPPTTPTVTTAPKSCVTGEKCPSGSWCNNGSMCYYPDKQMTCVAWPTSNVTAPATMGSPSCPTGTSPCSEHERCVAPGEIVSYSSDRWCMHGQSYYSTGDKMTCVKYGDTAPSGYSSCRPGDTNCIPEDSYGPSSGQCANAMKCYQKETDTNSRNDVYCTKMPMSTMASSDSVECPSGYSVCEPGSAMCKAKGDKWTDSNTSYYCMNAQKCSLESGGGICVGWHEVCPAGTKYCSEKYCIEPGEYKDISGSDTMSGYWCGGGGGMTFYSKTKAYCPPKKTGSTMAGMMWSAAEIKAVLDKLGSGWGLCRPNETNCIEPGRDGPSSGWCAWMPPGTGYMGPQSSTSNRTCPSLKETAPPPTTPMPVIPEQPEKCMTVMTKAFNSATGECKTFPSSCLPAGWTKNTECKPGEVVLPMPIPPPMIRECGPSEISGYNNQCVMPMYRWNIDSKTFEKCDSSQAGMYMGTIAAASTGTSKMKYTNCESMNFYIEKEWRTERYLVHPPEIDGQWYMPPWDAASPMLQYNPDTDALEGCKTSSAATTMMTVPGEMPLYYAPCMPVPEKDKGWMLKKFRSEYKMYQLYKNQPSGPVIMVPGQPVTVEPVVTPAPVVTGEQCKPYILKVKQTLPGDEQYWKDINRKLVDVPKDYPDLEEVKKLLEDGRVMLISIRKMVKTARCERGGIEDLRAKVDALHSDVFSQLPAYMAGIEDFARYGRCKRELEDTAVRLKALVKEQTDEESAAILNDLIAEIGAKLKEMFERSSDFDYDAAFECELYKKELDGQMAPLLIMADTEIGTIVDKVMNRLEPVFEELKQREEDRGRKIESLLVQVAEVEKAVIQLGTAAKETARQFSETVTVSLTALSRIEDKFAEQKAQIQSARDELITVIETAIRLVRETGCVKGAMRDELLGAFKTVAAVNWIGDRGDELARRLDLIMNSCKAKDIAPQDIDTLTKAIEAASKQNLRASYEIGMTKYNDVSTDAYYYGAFNTAACKKTMSQGRPAEDVLRQDALLMMLRNADKTDTELKGSCTLAASGVTHVSPYAVCAANIAYESGLSLKGELIVMATRLEIARWLVELLDLEMPNAASAADILKNYKDLEGLSDGAMRAVAAVVKNELMVGNVSEDEKKSLFRPDDLLKRADLAVILEKVLKLQGRLPTSCESPPASSPT